MSQRFRNSRRWSWRIVAGLALLCLAACQKKKAPADTLSVDQPHPPDAVAGAMPVATLERTGCYGECPVYRLTVNSDGTVVYVGMRWVKVLGRQVFKISETQLTELQQAFERANFAQLRDYDRVESTDDDWAHLSLRRGSSVKRVRHYHGDNSAPATLGALEDEFDRIVDSARLVGASGVSGAAPNASALGTAPAATAGVAPAVAGGAPGLSPSPSSSAKAVARPTADPVGPPDDTVADPDNHP